MSETGKKIRANWVFGLVFFLLAAGIVAAGSIYYQSYKEDFRTEVARQLSAIAALKSAELVQWRRERMSDGNIFSNNPAFSALVRRLLDAPGDADARLQIQAWIDKIQRYGQYDRVRLLDASGGSLLSAPGNLEPVSAEAVRLGLAAQRLGQVSIYDFYRSERDQRVYLSVMAPIFDATGTHPLLGVLMLRIDPAAYLYPFISRWPTPSDTAETLLVRRDGNDALFLSELKFQRDAALTLRFPLTRTEIPAVKAALGQNGIVEGVDYRGVPVFADVRAVPDSPWFLVTRLDMAEAFAPLREHLWATVLLVGAFVFSAGAGVGYLWRQQRARFYRERYEVVEALRESERFLGESQKVARIGSYATNLTAGTWQSSKALDEIFGIDGAFVRSVDAWAKLLHPDWRQTMNDYFAMDVVAKRGRFDKEYQIVRQRDGAVRWVHGLGELEFDAQHRPVRMVGTIQDITERKQAEAVLRESEQRFGAVFRGSPIGISLTRLSDGRFLDVNDAFLDLLGYAREEVVGSNPLALNMWAVPEDRAKMVQELRAPDRISAKGLETQFLMKSGEIREVAVIFDVIDVANERYIVGLTQDITVRKRQERELQEKNAELERFTYTVSHDLKSPLITIKGFAGALLQDVAAGRHHRLEGDLRRVADAADKMSSLLTDLLELSRVGRVVQQPAEVNLDELLRDVLRLLAGSIAQRHAEIVVQPGLPVVWADRQRLGEVWQNLIENALKFSRDQPQPRIEIGMRGSDAARVFFVLDNGVGIDPRYHETVFGLFNKLDARTEGTGIGLALVRRIVEVHGGRIWVESEGPGHGSAFCFTLPANKSIPPPNSS